MKKLTTPYFPSVFRYAAILLLAGPVYFGAEGSYLWSALTGLAGLLILTTRYVTEIHIKEQRYDEHVSVAGVKFGSESTAFTRLNKIVITSKNYSQTMNSRVQSGKLRYTEYTASLLHDENVRLELLVSRDKDDLLRDLKPYADFLKVTTQDPSA